MGRKIPGKKQHKIKDPLKQQQVRFNSIKNKINAPPTNPEEQPIPKSLQRVIELKDKVKQGIITDKRPKRKKSALKGLISTEPKSKKKRKQIGRPEKPIPVFKQEVGETDHSFMYRVNSMVESVLQEAKFENKYRVDVKRNMRSGEIEDVIKRPVDEIDKMLKQVRDESKKGKKKKKKKEERLTKTQKRAKKLAVKKEERELNKIDEFEYFKDDVKFGEVAHAPPTLTAPRKAVKEDGAPRPGKKNLLLKSILNSNETLEQPETKKTKIFRKSTDTGIINKKAKRKTLPIGVRKQLENTRQEMVDAYRQLKAKKNVETV